MSDDKKTKNVEAYVVYNYHQDELRLRQTKPSTSKMSPHELPMKVSFEVRVPSMDIPEISKTIEIPEAQIREAVADLAVEPSEFESDYPDPKRVLAQHDAESLDEQFSDMGLSDVSRNEKTEMLNWLRDLYSTEMQSHQRDGVLDVIEKSISEVKTSDE